MNQDSPIFIAGLHKSGTSLLRSLLDGHPELSVIPIEGHYFQNRGYWIENPYRVQPPISPNDDEIYDRFCAWVEHYNQLVNPYADTIVKGEFDEKVFGDSFKAFSTSESEAERILLYFESIRKAVKTDIGTGRFVEKSVENAEVASFYKKCFPKAKFLHIVRNPYANAVSLRKFKSKSSGSYPLLSDLIKTMQSNYYHLYRNATTMEGYKVIQFEDLLTQPEAVMKEVAEFLEIEFTDSLTSPTRLGQPWKGNSMSGKKFESISSDRLEDWKSEIFPIEVRYINATIPLGLPWYKYEKCPDPKGFWKRASNESLKKYVANRLYKHFLPKLGQRDGITRSTVSR